MKGIISFIGALAVSLLTTAAGVKFKLETLTIGGILLAALTAVLWLFNWGRLASFDTAAATEKARLEQARDLAERRRKIIEGGRDIVVKYTNQAKKQDFARFLSGQREYPDIRPHLSSGYLTVLHNGRMAFAGDSTAAWEARVEMFASELDKLEREWGLA